MTMRSSTGSERTSSQISIYNYPDHLNPFSEDDNHKRLRFWNSSKRNDNRRRSFSVANLRELWNFKPFSLKKKSSTLGIQKTSESPPVLRRNLESNSLYTGDQAFTNRRSCTNSLQSLNINSSRGTRLSETNLNFVRSPQRSTISEGYLTPQSYRFHPNRSSQASLVSSNPFESDIDSDATDIGNVSLGRRSYRKKRRAPLAPTREMLDKSSSSPVSEITTTKPQLVEVENQNKAIRSLAVEIEQFVNNSNESATVKIPTVVVEPSSVPHSPLTESNASEQPNFTKVLGTNQVEEDTTKNVQIDKLNSHTASSVVSSNASEGQQTETKTKVQKYSPKPPIRTHASLSKEIKIPSREYTSTSEERKNAQVDKLSSVDVQIVENSDVSKSPQAEHKILYTKYSVETPSQSNDVKNEPTKENKNPDIEYTSISTLVSENEPVDNIVNKKKASFVPKSPPAEHKIPNQICLSSQSPALRTKPVQENKIPNTEDTSTSDSVIESRRVDKLSNDVKIVETSYASKNSQIVHKAQDHICWSTAPSSSQGTNRNPAGETNIRNLEYTLTRAPVPKGLEVDIVNRNPNQIVDRENLNNFTTVQKDSVKKNNTAENYEYLNKPLAIFENSVRKFDRTEEGAPPAKAKSVKEIIDSINRSQKLLKDSAAKGTTVYSTSLYTENNHIRPTSVQRCSQGPEICPNISTDNSGVENNLQLESNYFQKSKINKTAFQYRESSPTALNLDWNPLPKPKRINNGSSI